MRVSEYLHMYPDVIGNNVWTCLYNFKSDSDFMYEHLKPTPVEIYYVGVNRWSIRVHPINKLTGQLIGKNRSLSRTNSVFRTEEECIEHYKSLIQLHIVDRQNSIERHTVKIELLREKIDSL